MDNYFNFQIKTTAETAEILLAFLPDLGFDTFEETTDGVNAYLPEANFNETTELHLAELQEQFEFTYDRLFVPYHNWNATWEANFQPVVVRNFCAVRASFHEPLEKTRFELVINPKMAFGTGHHETTYMVIDAMEDLPLKGAKVLDFGCGTGILAILAAQLGAETVEAVDIERESYLNTVENATLNGVTVVAYEGELSAVEGENYDVVLANINRNVLLETLPMLRQKLKAGGGHLVLSGILGSDETVMREAIENLNGNVKIWKVKNNWICLVVQFE